MAVVPKTLIAPEGAVESELFPGEGGDESGSALLTRLTTYVSKAVAKVADITFVDTAQSDAAIQAWAYHLAFKAAYTLKLSRPATEDFQVEVMGEIGFEKDQRDGIKELADEYFAEYMGILADAGAASAHVSGTPSFQSTNTFDW